MTPNKFERLFLQQYRELHEAAFPKRVLLIRQLWVFMGSVLIMAVLGVFLLFVEDAALTFFIPLSVGIILGNSASNLGAVMRRRSGWRVVEEITNWSKVYELLGKPTDGGKS